MKYIHCSFDVVNEFIPRVPTTRCKIEDKTTPRICVAPDIRHCLAAMPSAGRIIEWTRAAGLPVILHAYYLTSDKVFTDTKDKVADAEFTHEMWLLEKPTSVRRVDYEITSCSIQNGKDILGDPIKRIVNAEIRRVSFTDSLTELFCFSSADPHELKFTYGKIAANMDFNTAKRIKTEREQYKKHKAFDGLQRRIEAYRCEVVGKKYISTRKQMLGLFGMQRNCV